MKIKIRKNVFESNSSSTHSLTMVMKSEFDKWVSGELVYDRWNEELVPVTDETENDEDKSYLTYDQFCRWDYWDYETFVKEFTMPSGETVVSFGYYGWDG